MANEFVRLNVESDANTLADLAVERLTQEWDDWEPNDADLEVVQIEAIAPMAQNAAEVAARTSEADFRAFGEKLAGIPYVQGFAAVAWVNFILTDNLGHLIPGETTEIDIDGYAFKVLEDTWTTPGSLEQLNVAVECTTTGSAQNDLEGNSLSLITSLSFVSDVTISLSPEGGADAEDDPTYMNRLNRRLQLSSSTLVTLRDFELMGLDDPAVFRVVAIREAPRTVRVTAIGTDGLALPTLVKDRLIEMYEGYREANTIVLVENAEYTTIGVQWFTHVYPGWDLEDVNARITASLTEYLSPLAWGSTKNFGDFGSPGAWINETFVRKNKIIDLIGDIEGVDWTENVWIDGDQGEANAELDWMMPGPVALPLPGVIWGQVVSP